MSGEEEQREVERVNIEERKLIEEYGTPSDKVLIGNITRQLRSCSRCLNGNCGLQDGYMDRVTNVIKACRERSNEHSR